MGHVWRLIAVIAFFSFVLNGAKCFAADAETGLECEDIKAGPVDSQQSSDERKVLARLQGQWPHLPGVLPCKLTLAEYSALRFYTEFGSRLLNEILRQCVSDEVESQMPMLRTIYRAFAKLKPYKGKVIRKLNLDRDQIREMKKSGIYMDRAFASASASELNWPGNTRFEIESRNCRMIRGISFAPGEDEVLCLPGTPFSASDISEEARPNGRVLNKAKLNETEPMPSLEKFTSRVLGSCKSQPGNDFQTNAPNIAE